MKLYNAGSFFDPRAVPEADYDAVAAALAGLSRVIVESHPALVGARVDRLLDCARAASRGGRPAAQLEVAMGLETAHPDALDRLNKRFTLERLRDGRGRARAPRRRAARVPARSRRRSSRRTSRTTWLLRSIDAAFACGASVVSLVPTRPGNGAMEALAALGDVQRRRRSTTSSAASRWRSTTRSGRGRVFVDLWDLERFAGCPHCFAHGAIAFTR